MVGGVHGSDVEKEMGCVFEDNRLVLWKSSERNGEGMYCEKSIRVYFLSAWVFSFVCTLCVLNGSQA